MLHQPAVEFMIVVLLIGEHRLQARIQLRIEPSEHARRGRAIVDIPGRDHDGQQQSQRVRDDMLPAALDAFASVVSLICV